MNILRKIASAIFGGTAVTFAGVGLAGTLLLSWGACTPDGNPLVQLPLTAVWVVVVFGATAGLIAGAIKAWPEN